MTFPGQPFNKYGNVKKTEVDGIIFDSKKEAKYYQNLKAQKAAGEIRDFQMQVRFELIPKQTETVTVFDKKGRPQQKEKVIEHPCTYTADFVVTDQDGDIEVVDCKGNKSLDQKWPIKRKLMLWVHKVRIKEV